MTRPPMTPADRAYLARFFPTMTPYVVLVCTTPIAIKAWHPSGVLLWLIAMSPAFPMSAVFWILGRYYVELRDEYLRTLQVRQALIATGFAMTLATLWGFPELYALVPHLNVFAVPIVWCFGLAIGACVNAIIERGGES